MKSKYTQNRSKQIWNHLLMSGGYSIGYFSITVEGNLVRVYHYRTRRVTYFDRRTSFSGMQELCRSHGYEFHDLLNRHYPKSFRSLRKYQTA